MFEGPATGLGEETRDEGHWAMQPVNWHMLLEVDAGRPHIRCELPLDCSEGQSWSKLQSRMRLRGGGTCFLIVPEVVGDDRLLLAEGGEVGIETAKVGRDNLWRISDTSCSSVATSCLFCSSSRLSGRAEIEAASRARSTMFALTRGLDVLRELDSE